LENWLGTRRILLKRTGWAAIIAIDQQAQWVPIQFF
jgi:hypothetical protein